MDLIVSRDILAAKHAEKMASGQKVHVDQPVDLVKTAFGNSLETGGSLISNEQFSMLSSLKSVHRGRPLSLSGKYRSGLDFAFKDRGSIIQRLKQGNVSFATGDSLNDNWSDLMDAIRLDLTIKKEARPTVRQFVYNEMSMPNATKDVRPTELFPYSVVFDKNNGEGQAVRQGSNMFGQYDTIPMEIYAAGFQWTLLASLFDGTYDLSRLSEGVAVGYSAKKDDLAMKPIIDADYGAAGTTKHTAASTVGSNRQEKLYNTLMNAIDGLGQRTDPVTKRKIVATDLVLVCSSLDANHVQHVITGLGNSTPEKYMGYLSNIRQIVAYDGESIPTPNGIVTYSGVTPGVAFLVKRNRYMSIPVKRGLTAEIDENPDVKTLAQSQRAWYFVEAMYNEIGIGNFIQKITLPAW